MLEAVPPKVLKNADIVVDIGANQGLWSEAVTRFVRPRRLFAFEPSPEPYAHLTQRLLYAPSAKLFNVALSDYSGESRLHRFEQSEFNSLYEPATALAATYDISTIGDEMVQVTTLDDILETEKVDGELTIVKMDVQGAEMSVLKGAQASLRRTRCLIVELLFSPHYRGETMFAELHNYITASGQFRFHNFGTLARDSDGALLWADAVYLNVANLVR
ncbi:MAG: FkbM family methyltransferase [Actinomycetota bacterium]|nr:FkbM family methyltransferase [Actinomycetota bacterium]